MAHKLLRKELIGKKVLTPSHTEIGTLEEIVIDNDTGEIKYLLIRFSNKVPPNQKTDGKGRVICVADTIQLSGDQLVIS